MRVGKYLFRIQRVTTYDPNDLILRYMTSSNMERKKSVKRKREAIAIDSIVDVLLNHRVEDRCGVRLPVVWGKYK